MSNVTKLQGTISVIEISNWEFRNGITDVVTNLLMKVQHVTVSENSGHNSCKSLTMVWRTLSANVTESAAWLEVTLP